MTHRDWLPSLWGERRDDDQSPLLALRRQIETLFDDLDQGLLSRDSDFAIRSNVSETDKEIRITAELPGVKQEDIDVSIAGDRITIKGEKKSEKEETKEDDGRQYHRVERSSGKFQRMMTLPFEIDEKSVSAKFADGVLTVSIAKPKEVRSKTRKIAVKATD